MMQRVNYASKVLGDIDRPGVKCIVEAVGEPVSSADAVQLVDACLEHLGYLKLEDDTRNEIVAFARDQIGAAGEHSVDTVVLSILQLAVATREYQLA
jgi:hypothetical protein